MCIRDRIIKTGKLLQDVCIYFTIFVPLKAITFVLCGDNTKPYTLLNSSRWVLPSGNPYFLLFCKSSISVIPFLQSTEAPSNFPSLKSFNRQFLLRMRPIQFAFQRRTVFIIDLFLPSLLRISSFVALSSVYFHFSTFFSSSSTFQSFQGIPSPRCPRFRCI